MDQQFHELSDTLEAFRQRQRLAHEEAIASFDRLNAKPGAIHDHLDGQPTKNQLRNIVDKAITKIATI
jgi:hypothetical protein